MTGSPQRDPESKERQSDQPVTKLLYWIMGCLFAIIMSGIGFAISHNYTEIKNLDEGHQSDLARIIVLETQQAVIKEILTDIKAAQKDILTELKTWGSEDKHRKGNE